MVNYAWICRTKRDGPKRTKGRRCTNKTIPEIILQETTTKILRLEQFCSQAVDERIERIDVPEPNKLIYIFKNGTKVPVRWSSDLKKRCWDDAARGKKSRDSKRYWASPAGQHVKTERKTSKIRKPLIPCRKTSTVNTRVRRRKSNASHDHRDSSHQAPTHADPDQPAHHQADSWLRTRIHRPRRPISSYQAQVDYYTNYIQNHAGWQLAGIYTDEGITGTNVRKREGFKQMVSDALDGKIDLIITKSVSRFARNTVDSLTTVRRLKDAGVEVYFEKENIWTFDAKGELLITIMSSLAQEEARSISENVTWGHRKRFVDGKVTIPFSRFLGYDKGPNGNLIINPDEAVIVRRIYDLFLDGHSYSGICKTLTNEDLANPTGNRWSITRIKGILTNEKYKSDALLQKSYIADFLTKNRSRIKVKSRNTM